MKPIVCTKEINNRNHIKALCPICNKFKTKFLNLEQVKLLPNKISESENGSTFKNIIIRDKKALPL